MTAATAPYKVMKLASGSYGVLRGETLIASLARNSHQEGLNDAWMAELLDDVPAAELTAPFAAQRHFFRSLLEALQWLGIAHQGAPSSNPAHQGIRKSLARRGSLASRDCYQLRLLALHDRFYEPNTSLQSLERRKFIAPTGRTDGGTRVEWAITDSGRQALAEVQP